MRAYLAGPEVFLKKALEQAERKMEICRQHGITGIFPLDNKLDLSGMPDEEQGYAIARANEEMIRSCDIMIANMTPYQGLSADVGVAYEMGFMRALKRNVHAYSNDRRLFYDRVKDEHKVLVMENGVWRTPGKMAVENFGLADNLMLANAVHESGSRIITVRAKLREYYTDLTAFAETVRLAAADKKPFPRPSGPRLLEPA